MSSAQSFLLFLIVLGGVATMLRLVSRSTPTVPYPVLLAVGGILIGLLLGIRLTGHPSFLDAGLRFLYVVTVGAAIGAGVGAYLVMFVARALPVYTLLGISDLHGHKIPWSWRHLTFWGGVRLPQVNPQVSVVAYGIVVLSLLVQGGLLLPVAGLLGLRHPRVPA
jgi:NhaP-type Na+/H+ or K+/H+ antiporter